MNKFIFFLSLFGLAGLASAGSIGFGDIVNWTGAGSNRAAMVLDWNDGTSTRSMAWGYRWNGSATAEQMLRDVDSADPRLSLGFTFYSGFGYALTSAGYDLNLDGTNEHYASGFDVGTPGFWALYNGGPSTLLPGWTSSNFGVSGVTLQTDGWEGLSWAPNFNDAPPVPPIPAPVPEPATIIVLGPACLVRTFRSGRRAGR